jgi:hypothetical protein
MAIASRSLPALFNLLQKTSLRYLTTAKPATAGKVVNLLFIGKLDEKIPVKAFEGESLLDVSQRVALDVEGT